MATVVMKILKDYRSTDESCEGSIYFWLVSSEGVERIHFCDTIRPFLFLLVMLFVVGQQLGIRFSFPIHRLGSQALVVHAQILQLRATEPSKKLQERGKWSQVQQRFITGSASNLAYHER